jgi:purine nucleosidase
LTLAVRLDPTLPENYTGLVAMGGAMKSMVNTSSLSAEFNLHTNPGAGAIVFDAWKEFSLGSWETTVAHPFPLNQIAKLGNHQTPRSELFRKITYNALKFNREALGKNVLYTTDSLAMAVALDPEIITKANDISCR